MGNKNQTGGDFCGGLPHAERCAIQQYRMRFGCTSVTGAKTASLSVNAQSISNAEPVQQGDVSVTDKKT